MKHKILFLLVLLSVVCHSAWAYDFGYTYQGKRLFYSLSGGTARVVNPTNGNFYSYVNGDVVIPDTVEYNGNMYLVTAVANEAFRGCNSLTSVVFGNHVSSVGEYAFRGCTSLTAVTFSPSVTSLGNYAFFGCTSLDSVNLPAMLTSIGNYLFYNCSSLHTADIPSTVTSIGSYAFCGCINLASLSIPQSVASIGNYAFHGCRSLQSIEVAPGNTHFDSRDSCNAIIQTELNLLVQGCNATVIPSTVVAIGSSAFYYCSGLDSVTIPPSVTSIGDEAFAGCSGLLSVTIPAMVTSIGNYAFFGCSGLTTVRCLAATPPTMGTNNFANSYTDIFVPCRALGAYYIAANWNSLVARMQGMPDVDFTYTFLSSNEALGTVSVGEIDCDSNITVSASVHEGYRFAGWSDGGEDSVRTFHLSHDTVVTALFDSIAYVIAGLSADTVRGLVSGSDTVYFGDTVVLSATPRYGYHFTQWSDGNADNPRIVVASADMLLTAYFDTSLFSVVAIADSAAHGTVVGTDSVAYMTAWPLLAIPATGYHFTHWSDGDSNAARTITVEGDTTLTAYFEINTYLLTVLANDTALGTVTGGGTFTHGTPVTVTAAPATGYRFDRWSDSSLLSDYTFPLLGDLQLVAVFLPADTVFVHDTTFIPVHDTTIVTFYDTTVVTLHDTVATTLYDTVVVVDTVTLTEYVTVHDTTVVTLHDTTFVTVYDTVVNIVHDTTLVTDTLYLTDTLYIHDTVYVPQEDIDDVETRDVRIYQRSGMLVVEGAEGLPVWVYDAVGRQVASTGAADGRRASTNRLADGTLQVPVSASGVYLVKVGDHPATRVVVRR